MTSVSTSVIPVRQTYVGQVNVVGECFCFGLAHDYDREANRMFPVYLNLTGAATSVEAVWAKLAQGKHISISRKPQSVTLEPLDKGDYVRFQRRIEGLRLEHLMLLQRSLAEPKYPTDGAARLYWLWPDDELGLRKFGEHLRRTVQTPVFEPWLKPLYDLGRKQGLIAPLPSYPDQAGQSGIVVMKLFLNVPRWTELIQTALRRGEITLP